MRKINKIKRLCYDDFMIEFEILVALMKSQAESFNIGMYDIITHRQLPKYLGGDGDFRTVFREEVAAWCVEQEMPVQLAAKLSVNEKTYSPELKIRMTFRNETEATIFRLRWMGDVVIRDVTASV